VPLLVPHINTLLFPGTGILPLETPQAEKLSRRAYGFLRLKLTASVNDSRWKIRIDPRGDTDSRITQPNETVET
jgi:hypothetical protein